MDNQQQNRYLSVSYQLYTVDGDSQSLVEQTQQGNPFKFISGFGVSLDAFEQHVVALQPGEKFDFTIEPADAFGDYDEAGVHQLEREMFMVEGNFDDKHVYPGAVITLMDEEERRFMARVEEVNDEGVVVDTNHPLAGETLRFTGVVLENREAAADEIQRMLQSLSCEGCNCEDCNNTHTGGCGGCCGG
ncbi:MAG: FKBP-type peptidyl-prolyl cis-trans isomerase [Prevotella sp.]|nr:FKBP-type peptidyl-prolyl cis-trans isomerase [Prevotella sp.]